MKPLVIVGIVLMILGIAGLIFGGISYTKNKESAELGPIDLEIQEKERLSMHPAIGAVVLAGGVAVTLIGIRKGRVPTPGG